VERNVSVPCSHCEYYGGYCGPEACARARPGTYTVDQCHPCWKRLYGAPGVNKGHVSLSTTKPRLSVDQLAAIKRCQKARQEGRECQEDLEFMKTSPQAESSTPSSATGRLRWAYGVTSVVTRTHSLLPQTLHSLALGGFGEPRLFIDNCTHEEGLYYSKELGLEVTARHPAIRTAGNWILSMWELYIRNPEAERYALFQDDFVCYRNLRSYLERWYPGERNDSHLGYLNLYTFPSNESLRPGRETGWYLSNQFGRGAVALVFSREVVITLLSQKHLVQRTADMHRGHKAIDGGVVTALGQEGIKEYVHYPSLVQHIGIESSMGNNPHKQSESFKGENFDALSFARTN
jgi:hypothetical protein